MGLRCGVVLSIVDSELRLWILACVDSIFFVPIAGEQEQTQRWKESPQIGMVHRASNMGTECQKDEVSGRWSASKRQAVGRWSAVQCRSWLGKRMKVEVVDARCNIIIVWSSFCLRSRRGPESFQITLLTALSLAAKPK
jgi:hypothetical protein